MEISSGGSKDYVPSSTRRPAEIAEIEDKDGKRLWSSCSLAERRSGKHSETSFRTERQKGRKVQIKFYAVCSGTESWLEYKDQEPIG